MRTTTLSITFKGPFGQYGKSAGISSGTYGLTLHNDKVQDDLGVQPLLCVGMNRPNQSDRLLTIWRTGIQLGKVVLRFGYVCAGDNGVDGKLKVNWHPGPRQAAIEHFHGLFGPKLQVALDGVVGYFTALGDEVKFVPGDVLETPGDTVNQLKFDMLASICVTEAMAAKWRVRAKRLGLNWSVFDMPFDEMLAEIAKLSESGPAIAADVYEVGEAATEPAAVEEKFERSNGNRLRALLKVRLQSHFHPTDGVDTGYGDWLADVCNRKRRVDKLSAREAETALNALTVLQRGGRPGKYDRATLDAMSDADVMALYGQEFTGDGTSGRAHATQRLLSILG